MRVMAQICAMLVCDAVSAYAQEEGASRAFSFTRGRVNYWHTKPPPAGKRSGEANVSSSVWAEPVRTPDGRSAAYVPAPEVLEFLEDPTVEGAKRYLAWQGARMSKLRRAMEILQGLGPRLEADGSTEEQETATQEVPEAGRLSQVEVLYFKQGDCAYCDAQDRILQALQADRGIAVREVRKGVDPALWARYGVTVTPTLVIAGGRGPYVVLRGLASRQRLVTALQEVSHHDK